MRTSPRPLVVAFALTCLALFGSALIPPQASATPSEARCRDVSIPITLTGADAQHIDGTLCRPDGESPKTVQLLIPGAFYNHGYWDFGFDPGKYSYVRAATKAGYATLAIDRLGTGTSSHPPGALIDNNTSATSVHQVVTALRQGRVDGTRFDRVLEVGHSYGSITAWYEAGTYHDVDAVIISALLHSLSPTGAAVISTSLEPAPADAKFLGKVVDPTYITTRPGARKGFFYRADTDPRVLAYDEQTKDLATTSEVSGFGQSLVSPMPGDITVPVLVAMGRSDAVFCALGATDCSTPANIVTQERPHYAKAPCLAAWVSQNSAHDLNTAADAPAWFTFAQSWSTKTLPPDGTPAHC
ncbi:alpha/beta fold hydrolase [Pseudonocardia spinosispora]|uniref:alpha/beta fold hydrolase n=1 Tax=Pseudonocardia spinosispora TaxID=103441 RepID=UPI0003FB8AF3|nr:alpha/beta fold hydrolase [Pseudonocardia spinosispora]